MKRIGFTVAKNAVSNVVRGGATAIVAIVLPHFLTKTLDTDRFAAWSLMLQIAAYANYLDFGLQTTLARFVAQTTERQDHEGRDRIVSTSFAMLLAAASLAITAIGVVVWLLPHIVPGSSPTLLPELRLAVLVLAGSTALSLPFSTFSGILIGIHKNEYPAIAIGGSRIAGAVCILIELRHTHSLVALAACVAITNILGGILQVMFVHHLEPGVQLRVRLITLGALRELALFGAGLTTWSLSGLLVTGLDLTVLGYFRFSEVGFYAVGASLVTFVAGMNGAVSSALMTPLAALHASGSFNKIRDITLQTTNIGTFINLCLTCAIFLAGRALLRVWVGEIYAARGIYILQILVVATTVRLVAGPYASMLIATGQQKQGVAQGIVEGVTNLISSLLLGYRLGAIGVALGTLIGATCGFVWTCAFTIVWAKEVPLSRRSFLLQGIIRPGIAALPLLLFTILAHTLPSMSVYLGSLCLCILLTCIFTRRMGGFPLPQFLGPANAKKDYTCP